MLAVAAEDDAIGQYGVLVVEDQPMMLRMVAGWLSTIGFGAIYSVNGVADAMDVMKSRRIDLVISDLRMFPHSGLDFLRSVRSASKFADLPFIMLTAHADRHYVREAIQAGVSDYVVKPVSCAELQDKVKRTLRKHRHSRP